MEKIANFIKKYNIHWIALGVFFFVLDFVSKQIVLNTMKIGDEIPLIGSFIEIEYVINEGAAFGIQFKDPIINKIIWILISVVGSAVLIAIFVLKNKKLNTLTKTALILMASGCVGNLIDRAFYTSAYLGIDSSTYPTGGVVDFIGVNFGSWPFPRFNIADSCLVIGTILLIVWLLVSEFKEILVKKENAPKEPTEKVLSKDEIEREGLENTQKTTDENIENK